MAMIRQGLKLSAFQRLFSTRVTVSEDQKQLRLLYKDENERRYHGVWLRHNCRCRECLPPLIQQNIVHHSNLMNLKITGADSVNDETVRVEWDSSNGPHSCEFAVDWLIRHDYSSPAILQERKDNEKPLVASDLPRVEYTDIMSDKMEYFKWMKLINNYGICFINNVPLRKKEMSKVCEAIAEAEPTGHVPVFDLISVENPTDIGYTTKDLLLHMDSNYFEGPPGILSLFCLKFDNCVKGGESTFLDAFPVVEEFRRLHPQHFETLTRVPYMNHRVHHSLDGLKSSNVYFKYSSPHITVDHYNQVTGISWSPQHHAPLVASESDVGDYYEAFITLATMFDESPLKIHHRLKPGEAVVLNNHRFLHARNEFETNGGIRHIQGSYVNIDFFRSKFHSLSKQYEPDSSVKHMFNRSYVA